MWEVLLGAVKALLPLRSASKPSLGLSLSVCPSVVRLRMMSPGTGGPPALRLTHTYMYIYIYVCMCIYIYIRSYLCICLFAYVSIYTYFQDKITARFLRSCRVGSFLHSASCVCRAGSGAARRHCSRNSRPFTRVVCSALCPPSSGF